MFLPRVAFPKGHFPNLYLQPGIVTGPFLLGISPIYTFNPALSPDGISPIYTFNPALSPDHFYSCPWGFLTGKTHEKCQTSRYHPIHAKYSCMYNVYLINISYVFLYCFRIHMGVWVVVNGKTFKFRPWFTMHIYMYIVCMWWHITGYTMKPQP